LLSNPSGPLRKEQEQSLLLELRTAKTAVAPLSTIYSRQQANKPALQSAASDLLQRLNCYGVKSLCRCVHGMARNGIPRGSKSAVSARAHCENTPFAFLQ